ncbi:hypothetical protein HDV00_012012 [Rhizophlyctis rosea]|nr:hypothetical protein HDV00_012012 [Rhizophlyctis rosea]
MGKKRTRTAGKARGGGKEGSSRSLGIPPYNHYSGFHPTPGWTPDRIDPTKISPKDFFTKYIATRTPCIFTSPLPDRDFLPHKKWTIPYLKRVAGAAVVQVEKKTAAGTFGSGQQRLTMPFADFLTKLENGETNLYMTTQYESTGKPSHYPSTSPLFTLSAQDLTTLTTLLQPPLHHLLPTLPLRPSLLTSLIPQQLNLWLGASPPSTSPTGTSSGLHHDFQDNLYILLRGRKRFTIFSPLDAHHLSLVGDVKKVHENGLIVYEAGVRGDGAFEVDVARWRVEVAQKKLRDAESEGGDVGEAEKEVERVLLKLMRVRGGGDDEDVEDMLVDDFVLSDEDLVDDFDDFEGGNGLVERAIDDEEEEEESEDDEAPLFPTPSTQKRKLNPSATLPSSKKSRQDPPKPTPKPDPPSFSRITTTALHPHPITPHPTYPTLHQATPTTFTLNPNEMLYLPASWFHEVTSYSDESANVSGEANVHMSLNYWCAPPTKGHFEGAYEDGYWEEVWEDVLRVVERVKSLGEGDDEDGEGKGAGAEKVMGGDAKVSAGQWEKEKNGRKTARNGVKGRVERAGERGQWIVGYR